MTDRPWKLKAVECGDENDKRPLAKYEHHVTKQSSTVRVTGDLKKQITTDELAAMQDAAIEITLLPDHDKPKGGMVNLALRKAYDTHKALYEAIMWVSIAIDDLGANRDGDGKEYSEWVDLRKALEASRKELNL